MRPNWIKTLISLWRHVPVVVAGGAWIALQSSVPARAEVRSSGSIAISVSVAPKIQVPQLRKAIFGFRSEHTAQTLCSLTSNPQLGVRLSLHPVQTGAANDTPYTNPMRGQQCDRIANGSPSDLDDDGPQRRLVILAAD